MDSEEPPNVRVACSGDIDEVVRLMHDAAAWMSAKGTPAWDVARIDRTFAETFVLRSELLVASCSDGIVGCCTLSAEDLGKGPALSPACRYVVHQNLSSVACLQGTRRVSGMLEGILRDRWGVRK
jgi:hypothetical protein